MKKAALITAGIISTLLFTPAWAERDRGDRQERGEYKGQYKEYYKKRHQMSVDMMTMLSETMTILRDLNHKPTAKERDRLSNMIDQLDQMRSDHEQMSKEHMDKRHMRRGDDDDDRR